MLAVGLFSTPVLYKSNEDGAVLQLNHFLLLKNKFIRIDIKIGKGSPDTGGKPTIRNN